MFYNITFQKTRISSLQRLILPIASRNMVYGYTTGYKNTCLNDVSCCVVLPSYDANVADLHTSLLLCIAVPCTQS